jgi:hypothetical protein
VDLGGNPSPIVGQRAHDSAKHEEDDALADVAADVADEMRVRQVRRREQDDRQHPCPESERQPQLKRDQSDRQRVQGAEQNLIAAGGQVSHKDANKQERRGDQQRPSPGTARRFPEGVGRVTHGSRAGLASA